MIDEQFIPLASIFQRILTFGGKNQFDKLLKKYSEKTLEQEDAFISNTENLNQNPNSNDKPKSTTKGLYELPGLRFSPVEYKKIGDSLYVSFNYYGESIRCKLGNNITNKSDKFAVFEITEINATHGTILPLEFFLDKNKKLDLKKALDSILLIRAFDRSLSIKGEHELTNLDYLDDKGISIYFKNLKTGTYKKAGILNENEIKSDFRNLRYQFAGNNKIIATFSDSDKNGKKETKITMTALGIASQTEITSYTESGQFVVKEVIVPNFPKGTQERSLYDKNGRLLNSELNYYFNRRFLALSKNDETELGKTIEIIETHNDNKTQQDKTKIQFLYEGQKINGLLENTLNSSEQGSFELEVTEGITLPLNNFLDKDKKIKLKEALDAVILIRAVSKNNNFDVYKLQSCQEGISIKFSQSTEPYIYNNKEKEIRLDNGGDNKFQLVKNLDGTYDFIQIVKKNVYITTRKELFGKPLKSEAHYYDGNNSLVRKYITLYYDKEKELCIYDKNGRLECKNIKDLNEVLIELQQYRYKPDGTLENTTTSKYSYDETTCKEQYFIDGKIVTETVYKKDGERIKWTNFNYDKVGSIISKETFEPGKQRATKIEVYGKNGKLLNNIGDYKILLKHLDSEARFAEFKRALENGDIKLDDGAKRHILAEEMYLSGVTPIMNDLIKKYNINIHLHPLVNISCQYNPPIIGFADDLSVFTNGNIPIKTVAQQKAALLNLKEQLEKYPEDFIKAISHKRGINIAFYETRTNPQLDTCGGCYTSDINLICLTTSVPFHHEFYHMLDYYNGSSREPFEANNRGWRMLHGESYLGIGSYYPGDKGFTWIKNNEKEPTPPAFARIYGMTNANEDQATVGECLFDPLEFKHLARKILDNNDAILARKVKFIVEEYEGWSEKKMNNEYFRNMLGEDFDKVLSLAK